MQYEIVGGSFPAVKCKLSRGEVMKCEGGSMSWMDAGIKMSTEGGGGIGKALGRAFSGESIFVDNQSHVYFISWMVYVYKLY